MKSVVNGVTTYYVGNHYIIPLWDEKKGSEITKYYGVYPEPGRRAARHELPHLPLRCAWRSAGVRKIDSQSNTLTCSVHLSSFLFLGYNPAAMNKSITRKVQA